MRVSFESRCDSTSSCAGSLTNRNCQQPGPNGVAIVVSLMHWPSGKSPAFCSDFGGIAYSPTVSVSWLSASDGELELSDDVFVSAQTSSWFEEPGPGVVPSPCASSAAFELMKYSVPPRLPSYDVPGDCAGQSVKPEFPLSSPCVSICVTSTDAALEASAAFEKA